MLETLDDQLNSLTIFRIVDRPVDVSAFITKIEKGWGLNPLKHMKNNNLNESMETVLTMFNQSESNPAETNEVIEEYTKNLIDRNGMKSLMGYFLDHSLHFKKLLTTDIDEKIR